MFFFLSPFWFFSTFPSRLVDRKSFRIKPKRIGGNFYILFYFIFFFAFKLLSSSSDIGCSTFSEGPCYCCCCCLLGRSRLFCWLRRKGKSNCLLNGLSAHQGRNSLIFIFRNNSVNDIMALVGCATGVKTKKNIWKKIYPSIFYLPPSNPLPVYALYDDGHLMGFRDVHSLP